MRGRPWLPGTSPAQVAMPSHCRKETPTTRGSRNSSGRHPGGEWESSPSPGSATLTRGWPVAADTRRSGEGARLCLSRWAWNASRAHSGTGQSYPPPFTRRETEAESNRPAGATSSAVAAPVQDPAPSAHATPTLWRRAQPPGSVSPLPPTASPRINPARLWSNEGSFSCPGKDPTHPTGAQQMLRSTDLLAVPLKAYPHLSLAN